jgi:hypothetical protein
MSVGAGRLFVSDIDGTLVTPDKRVTAAAAQAVADLRAAGVPFSVVSSRPPRGMLGIVRELGVTLPFAAFNGGEIVAADGSILTARHLDADVTRAALQLIASRGLHPWVFADNTWLLQDLDSPNIERERRAVGFEPEIVTDFDAVIDRVGKIVVSSNDAAALDRIEADLRQALAGSANVERSQPYYVDVTHPLANKGDAVKAIAVEAGADLARTIVIGDMTNDVAMFRVAGFAIAMGQAPGAVTSANTEEGFAKAVAELVLPRFATSPEAPA